MDKFDAFCLNINVVSNKKIETAINFIWYNQQVLGIPETCLNDINDFFNKAHLPKYNSTYLKQDLTKSVKAIKGSKKDCYKLSRKTLDELNATYSQFLKATPITLEELTDLNNTPFLSSNDIENGKKMAELYLVIHCLENSVRRFIEWTLGNLDTNWWDSVKNSELEKKLSDRKAKEVKNKWFSPRGDISPLYYLDWSDLVKIIRKKESDFIDKIGDLKFVELRLEELERTRNIIAHNGILPNADDYNMLILYFKNWCKQLN
ncbi:MAG TPA: Swt1 family HEPN domain-containing protein [Mucilaginibacter sp.]